MSAEAAPRNVTAADISWMPVATPTWPPSRDVLAAAVEALPEIDDDLAAELIEALALALVAARERIGATRRIASTLLQAQHDAQREVTRLRARLAELLDERREARPKVAA